MLTIARGAAPPYIHVVEPARYDAIGMSYSRHRQADPRIADGLAALLGLPPGRRVVEVGAGTGNYSAALATRGYRLVAVEPAQTMRAQARKVPNVEWVGGRAEHLPLVSGCAEAAVCVLALHHFTDPASSLRELRRVVRGPIVIFTVDPRSGERFWLEDYFPDLWNEATRSFPPIANVAQLIEDVTGDAVEIVKFALPPDLKDTFAAAGWRRPAIYLEEDVRAGISGFTLAPTPAVESGLDRLRADLTTGEWQARYGAVLNVPVFDAGYRFLRALPRS